MMTDYPKVICGARENRPDGHWECVRPPDHADLPHVWFKLNTGSKR